MGVFSELDLENQQAELEGHGSKAAEVQTLQAKLIQQHEQKKAAAASEVPSKEPAEEPVAKTEAVAHESRIFCGLSFDFPLDLSGIAFTDAVRVLPEHCRKAGAVLYFADMRTKILAECAKLHNLISLVHISLVAVIMS